MLIGLVKDSLGRGHIVLNDTDHPKESCGVFGVYGPGEDVARLTFYGLYALQHRGQESAGIATSNGKDFSLHTGMGLVSQVFDEDNLGELQGHIAIGHTRYSTTHNQYLLKTHIQAIQLPLLTTGTLQTPQLYVKTCSHKVSRYKVTLTQN
jgi:glutamine phosphoribosylpyrophosphate amidotransferase